MTNFIHSVFNPDIPFLRYALIAGILSSISFGIVGTYVVARRITYIAGAISHCVLGGIGAALYFQTVYGLKWCHPLLGAFVSSILAAVVIGLVNTHAKEREDTIISALWAVGMATGLIFISKTPAYIDPMNYLFGNILLISKTDIIIVAVLDLIILVTGVLLYNKFLAFCFDEEFAKTRNINTKLYYFLLLCMTSATIFLLMKIVGLIMVIALLSLPVAIANQFSKKLWHMMILSIIISIFFITSGLAVSYNYNLPAGSTIIIIAGIIYMLVIVVKIIIGKLHRK
ncbi:metal ABC transporter permease [bacterium]|nr:metal ABC transporter permease [bacterium]